MTSGAIGTPFPRQQAAVPDAWDVPPDLPWGNAPPKNQNSAPMCRPTPQLKVGSWAAALHQPDDLESYGETFRAAYPN